jgi:uncharacterized protein with PIN domain
MSEERLRRIEGRLASLEDGQKAIMRDLEAQKDEVDRTNRILLTIQQESTEAAKQTKDLVIQTKDLTDTVIRVVVRLDERVSRLEKQMSDCPSLTHWCHAGPGEHGTATHNVTYRP